MTGEIILNRRYQLQERLGTGGMAVVYRARDLMLERDVAIKLLRENYSPDPAFRERFHQEAKAAANLSHPNIVTIHDFGYDDGRLFIVMEYIPGTDLKSILQRRGRFTIHDSLNLIIQACAGVGYAHRAGLVHCDIKAQNFLITPDNRLKVTDFGIARALASIHPEEKSDVVWGSPQYFSPEQASGLAPSPASDVYSLGVVLYEMLTGRLPFSATSAEELARLHRESPPPPPSRYNPNIPPSLELILLKVLSKEPSTRYRTADQLGRVIVSLSKQPAPPKEEVPSDIQPTTSTPSINPYRQSVARPTPNPRATLYTPQRSSRAGDSRSYHLQDDDNPLDIDWMAVLLGLVALVSVGGLIPFWIWVYFLYQ